jgi:hypothetical protein
MAARKSFELSAVLQYVLVLYFHHPPLLHPSYRCTNSFFIISEIKQHILCYSLNFSAFSLLWHALDAILPRGV